MKKKREFEQARQIYTSLRAILLNNGRAKKALEALGGGKQQGGQGIDLPQDEARKLIAFIAAGKARFGREGGGDDRCPASIVSVPLGYHGYGQRIAGPVCRG
ncbi:MAG: hypothetical protein R3D43_04640 [Tepidamorphaceae bacterium]